MRFVVFHLLIMAPCCASVCHAQTLIDSFRMYRDVKITLDIPSYTHKETMLILYALPNGNTTAQTMGKKMAPGDDWHFDIQHIKAPTAFFAGDTPTKYYRRLPGKQLQELAFIHVNVAKKLISYYFFN